MSEKTLPNPLYGCQLCYEDWSWPASDLYWSDALKGWCCENCWDSVAEHWVDGDVIDEVIDHGISLADELKRRGLSR